MPLDGHEVLSIMPSKLWIIVLGRRNFVSKGREPDECSEYQVDDMIPLPCWSGVWLGGPGLSATANGGSWKPFLESAVYSKLSPRLKQVCSPGLWQSPLDRKCQPSYFLVKLQQISSNFL